MHRDLLVGLDEENSATFSSCRRLHNVGSVVFALGHVSLEGGRLVGQVERPRHKIEVMLEMPLHALEDLRELSLICSDSCSW